MKYLFVLVFLLSAVIGTGEQKTSAPVRQQDVVVSSWYGIYHQGRLMANGKPFDRLKLTAAHRSLPLGTCVEVINLSNHKHVILPITDRGPYIKGRGLDVSEAASTSLGFHNKGTTLVSIENLGKLGVKECLRLQKQLLP